MYTDSQRLDWLNNMSVRLFYDHGSDAYVVHNGKGSIWHILGQGQSVRDALDAAMTVTAKAKMDELTAEAQRLGLYDVA